MADALSITVQGQENIVKNIFASVFHIETKATRAVAYVLQRTYDLSQEWVPVDTGELQQSGYIINDGLTGEVGYGTDHCWYQELGTRNMAANPYLAPAFSVSN